MTTRSPASFDETYQGTPPWDIGRPQPALVELEHQGRLRGRILDAGCGTGENALYLAERGHDVWGIDASPRAIAKAQEKTRARRLPATFLVHDALQLAALPTRFETIVDSGLFHVFSDSDRSRYVDALRSVLLPGGRVFILAFCDREPTDWGGPRRVHQDEFRAAFHDGWKVRSVTTTRFATNLDITGHAWLAEIERVHAP